MQKSVKNKLAQLDFWLPLGQPRGSTKQFYALRLQVSWPCSLAWSATTY